MLKHRRSAAGRDGIEAIGKVTREGYQTILIREAEAIIARGPAARDWVNGEEKASS